MNLFGTLPNIRISGNNGGTTRKRDHCRHISPQQFKRNRDSPNDNQVGGSLAGLFSGLVLKHLGHNVQIFERSPSALLQSQGKPSETYSSS